MKKRVQNQEEDQSGPGERLWKRTVMKLNKEDATGRSRWRKLINDV